MTSFHSNVRVLTALDPLDSEEIHKYPIRLFLAGGISNCPDWQSEAITLIQRVRSWQPNELLIFNPRNPNFNQKAGPNEIRAQVTWEYRALNQYANIYWFWFPKETTCPITLYELGRSTHSTNPILLGSDQEYPRLITLHRQMQLARPEVLLFYSLPEMALNLINLVS